MWCMACIAFFWLLLTEVALKGGNQRFDFSGGYPDRSDLSMAKVSSILKPVQTSGRLAKFFLYTPRAVKKSRTLDTTNSESLLDFNPSLGTKIIIHGFLDSVAIAPWMHDMKDELLTYDDYNVIIVDWSAGNSLPYSRAADNTEQVGQEISELFTILFKERGAKPETFHLIGHSLGSHVASFVGKRVRGIGRITGLDPASPRFENEGPSRRLDPSDAAFVDVIHSDAGGIGMTEATGHQDFYPNGGNKQPGCTATNSLRALIQDGVVEGARNVICSHTRATLLFSESINSRRCKMTGVLCNSWEDFSNGQCMGCGASGERCAVMGFHANASTTGRNRFQKYFLLTTSQEPYCAYEYRVTFDVEVSGNPARGGLLGLRLNELSGIGENPLKLSIRGSGGISEFELDDDRFHNNSKYAIYMVPSKLYLGNIDAAVVIWTQPKSARLLSAVARRRTAPQIRRIEITAVKDLLQSPNFPEGYVLCTREAIAPNRIVTFKNDYC